MGAKTTNCVPLGRNDCISVSKGAPTAAASSRTADKAGVFVAHSRRMIRSYAAHGHVDDRRTRA